MPEEEKKDDKKDEGGAGGSGHTDPLSDKGSVMDRDSLRAMVKELLAEERATSGEAGAEGSRAARIDIEAEAEKLVKLATEKLMIGAEKKEKKGEKTVEERLAEVESKTEKEPKHLRRSTKMMWGSGE